MASNIGCFAAGCSNGVIGQCAGYKGNCGQFYCYVHAAGKLCSECGGRKHLEEVVRDYSTAARKIYVQEPTASIGAGFLFILIGVISGVVAMAVSGFVDSLVWFMFWLILAVPCFFYWSRKTDKVEVAIADTDKTKPRFREFYKLYKRAEGKAEAERNRILAKDVAIAFFGGAVTGFGNAVNEAGKAIATPPPPVLQGTHRDTERAVQSLEKTIAQKK